MPKRSRDRKEARGTASNYRLLHFRTVRRGRLLPEILPHHHRLIRVECPAPAHPEGDRRSVDDVAPGIGAQRKLVATLLARGERTVDQVSRRRTGRAAGGWSEFRQGGGILAVLR